MARTTKKSWPYITGQKGRNRVRGYGDPNTGIVMLEFREPSPEGATRKARVSTGHRDGFEGRRQADERAARLRRANFASLGTAQQLTLRRLFDMYLGEVTPGKSAGKQAHDRRAIEVFLRQFGEGREARTLNVRDWQAFIRDRSSGRIRPTLREGGRGTRKLPDRVGNRQIEYELRLLLAILNWATLAGDGNGGYLLERNPLQGLKLPRNESPNRPVLFEDEYQSMLGVAGDVYPLCRVLFVLLNETGHRGKSVVHLRWSYIDLFHVKVCWRGDLDKRGKEHTTPLSESAVAELRRARWQFPSLGDG